MPATTVKATLLTEDNTTTTIWSSPTAFTGGFVFYLNAHNVNTSEQAMFAGHVGRSDDDNSIIVAGLHPESGDTANYSATAVENGNKLDINVTGQSGEEVDWVLYVTYYN